MWLVLSLSFSHHGFAYADSALQAGLDVGDEPGDERCHEPEESAHEQREGEDEAARGAEGAGSYDRGMVGDEFLGSCAHRTQVDRLQRFRRCGGKRDRFRRRQQGDGAWTGLPAAARPLEKIR